MINFGNLEQVEKTFTRKSGKGERGQNWTGIKHRRFESSKGKKAAIAAGKEFVPFVGTEFTMATSTFKELGLNGTLGLRETKLPDGNIVLLVVEEAQAKFMKAKYRGDERLAKSSKFNNTVMEADMIEAGLLSEDELVSTYFNLVKQDIEGAPSYVKGGYLLEVSDSVSDDSSDEEEDEVDEVEEEVEEEEEEVEEDNF
jgi:hypothetical protein